MPRVLSQNLGSLNDIISKRADGGRLESKVFKENDWYSKNILKIKNGKQTYKGDPKRVRSLDLTDADMSDSPLKRYHQVVICGDTWDKTGTEFNGLSDTFSKGTEYIITAQLPKSFKYNIGGAWSPPMKSINADLSSGLLNAAGSMLLQNQASSVMALATMSTWEAPKPLQIQLTLQCLDDVADQSHINTLEAIDILSRWALPYGVNKLGTYSGIPGPSIPSMAVKWTSKEKLSMNIKPGSKPVTTYISETKNKKLTISETTRDGRLSVLIGGMLFLDWCILKDISISYPNTKAQYLHDYSTGTFTGHKDAGIRLLPIRTDITLTFETVMGLTQTNFQNMLALRDNSNPADAAVGLDLDKVDKVISAMSGGLVERPMGYLADNIDGIATKMSSL